MGDCVLVEDFITLTVTSPNYKVGVSGLFKNHISLSQIDRTSEVKMYFGEVSGGVSGSPVWGS